MNLVLQVKTESELEKTYSLVSGILEMAAVMSDPQKARNHIIKELEKLSRSLDISTSNGRRSDGKISIICKSECLPFVNLQFEPEASVFISVGVLKTLPLPTAKCHMFHWEKDNFGNAQN